MSKKIFLLLVLAFPCACLAQGKSDVPSIPTEEKPTIPSNNELITRAKLIYISSQTFYMKHEQLEKALLSHKEFGAWDLQITNKERAADLIINVRRVQFQNNFVYTVTDRVSETVVMAGQVNSFFGTAFGKIADDIIHKMKVAHKALQPPAPKRDETARQETTRLLDNLATDPAGRD